MAENGHGRQSAVDPELLEDLDAFIPKPVAALKFGGKVYEIPHYRDLVVGDLLQFIEIWNEEGGGARETWERAWRRLKILAPELPDEAKHKLTGQAMERLLDKATKAAADRPPVQGEAGSASASPLPSTGDSIPETATAS